MITHKILRRCGAVLGLLALPLVALAQTVPDESAPVAISIPAGDVRGPETNLPMPRFVSLKVDETNVRRGPSLTHRVDWVFTRRDMPLQIVAEYGHWRRVIDRDGQGGWIHYAMLSGVRTVIVDQDMEPLFSRPDSRSRETAVLQAGVIARINKCEPDWCQISAGGFRGWAPKTALWGVGKDEILN